MARHRESHTPPALTKDEEQGNVVHAGGNAPDPRRRSRRPAVGGEGPRVWGPQQPSRVPTGPQADHTPRSSKGLGTPWPPCCRTWV